ncbi:unnamed protein product [Auanema sp. JU1783]|nr:unnamed protein product [Auanema sp. JU1783]
MDSAITGTVEPSFEKLKTIFRENFEKGLEKAGASFAVYHHGKLVVDLFGGYANENIGQFWTEHSMSVLFSTTKSISATILAFVLDKEKIGYDEKVSKFWPEFAKNGKEDITISQVVLHQAGLPYTDKVISRNDAADWKKMSEYFENAQPVWAPGKMTGYHALTIGFLIDQIVRRIDPAHRGILTIFQEDFRDKYNITDLMIGLERKCQNNRVALIRQPTEDDMKEEGERNPIALKRYFAYNKVHHKNLYNTWPWITTEDYNDLENRLVPMPSNMGIGTARGLAQFHTLLAEKKILSKEFYERNLQVPVLEEEMDVVNGYSESKGCGFQFTKNPFGDWIFGHSGFGGQNVRVDTINGLSYAYITNGLKIADADQVEPWHRLVEELYRIIGTN